MMANYLTVSEICKETDVSNSSCRRYLSEFGDFFSTKGGSRVKKYEEQAVNIVRRIKHLYDEGKDKDEIYNILINEFPLVVNDGEQHIKKDTVPELATGEDVEEIRKLFTKQEKFNAELLKRLDQQTKYINRRMEERDKVLMQSINESLETRKQLASAKEKKGFFARLFGK